MRKVCVFLLFLLVLQTQILNINANQVIQTNQRSVLAYEVIDVTISNTELKLSGWGLLPDKHHFTGASSHQYFLELQSPSHYLEYKGTIKPTNLTKLMEYRGYPKCSSASLNQTNCNYDFKNVGFDFTVPLSDLKTGHLYKTSLKIKSIPLNKSFKSDLYYPKDHSVERIHKDRNIKVESHYQTMQLASYYHTLVARTAPGMHSPELKIGASCSNGYENRAYFQLNSLFKNIRGIETHDKLITYFKLNVKDAGCFDNRRRVIEGNYNDTVAYIPSIYVNYHGEALKINVEQIFHKPVIQAENQSIVQFTPYEPLDYAQATDKRDGNISHKIKVTYNNVDSLVPGQYKSCYEVHNSLKRSDSKCIIVDVIKANTYYRYVDERSVDLLTKDSTLWGHEKLKSLIERILARKA